jgi:hypothetical protein
MQFRTEFEGHRPVKIVPERYDYFLLEKNILDGGSQNKWMILSLFAGQLLNAGESSD